MKPQIFVLAAILVLTGIGAAYNARWIRDGLSPWWTSYFISAITATIYTYQLRANVLPLAGVSIFQHFFFHSAWYATTILVVGEKLATHKLIGVIFAFIGMMMFAI